LVVGVDSAVERIHAREDVRRFVEVVLVLLSDAVGQAIDARLEVDQGVVEIDIENLFGSRHGNPLWRLSECEKSPVLPNWTEISEFFPLITIARGSDSVVLAV